MSDEVKTQQPQPTPAQGEVSYYYIKSNYFRVVHVDGLYGGPAPTLGNMVMTIFSERVAFPEKSVNDASGNDIVQKRVVKNGHERELEVSLAMNLIIAKVMHQWLGNAIKNTEQIQQQAQIKMP
jgi:hypothetical protein